MINKIRSIPLTKLHPHPENPNKMSAANFKKLVANIERTGCYEPIIARCHPKKKDHYQLINGHHRKKALEALGKTKAQTIIWDIDDDQARIFLATLNNLAGKDDLKKKLSLLKKLQRSNEIKLLARILPMEKVKLEKLLTLKFPAKPLDAGNALLANPLVFFVSDTQLKTIETALARAAPKKQILSKAKTRAAALENIAAEFLTNNMEI
jgi:ParB-like chromosome segregation protein Spo0J